MTLTELREQLLAGAMRPRAVRDALQELCKELVTLRERAGLTVEQFAKSSGVCRETLVGFEFPGCCAAGLRTKVLLRVLDAYIELERVPQT